MLKKLLPSFFAAATTTAVAAADLQSIPFRDADGGERTLKEFAGQVVLIVNVASKCGFTKQYEGLEALYQKHKDAGLVILAFPCNDFGGQEPGSLEEIRNFCTMNFGVTFPIMDKITIRGSDKHPLYAAMPGRVMWNFGKHLVGRDGTHIDYFGSRTKPDAAEFTAAIEKALAAPRPE
ncbi:MAG: glutathione peroxidase [Luteolibacter sp.]|jgi:glutathione peroxidase